MSRNLGEDPGDPRTFINAPVIAALNGIVLRAVIGFTAVAGSASVPLILHLDPPVHDAFHFLVPGIWIGGAAMILVLLLLRPAPREPDVWSRAAEVDPGLTRFARFVSTVMMVGWLAAFAVVLVHHHLSSPREVFVTLGIIVPLTLAAWIVAVLGWSAWSRATLARAEHEAAGRLRQHISHLPRSIQPR